VYQFYFSNFFTVALVDEQQLSKVKLIFIVYRSAVKILLLVRTAYQHHPLDDQPCSSKWYMNDRTSNLLQNEMDPAVKNNALNQQLQKLKKKRTNSCRRVYNVQVSSNNTKSHDRRGDRAFGIAGTRVWNDLPSSVVSAPSLAVFKKNLKTHLFQQSYSHWRQRVLVF